MMWAATTQAGSSAWHGLDNSDAGGCFEALGEWVIEGTTSQRERSSRGPDHRRTGQLPTPPLQGHDMRRTKYAKIVATLGPASDDPQIIRALFKAGADVFRLNFSYGTHDDHKRSLALIR